MGVKNNQITTITLKNLKSEDTDNILALTWFGKKYYRKAEDLYQQEMTKP